MNIKKKNSQFVKYELFISIIIVLMYYVIDLVIETLFKNHDEMFRDPAMMVQKELKHKVSHAVY